MATIDWPPSRPPRRRRGRLFLLAVLGVLVLGAGTALSYYVDALWFDSLGFRDVFWKTLNLQAGIGIEVYQNGSKLGSATGSSTTPGQASLAATPSSGSPVLVKVFNYNSGIGVSYTLSQS